MGILYSLSHRQDSTYRGGHDTSWVALAGVRGNSSWVSRRD